MRPRRWKRSSCVMKEDFFSKVPAQAKGEETAEKSEDRDECSSFYLFNGINNVRCVLFYQ